MTTKKITLSIRVHIDHERIKGLLDSASRGSAYWCLNDLAYENETEKALTKEGVEVKDMENGDNWNAESTCKRYILDMQRIKRGLTSMAKKDLQHFTDFINQDYDQTTGDVFLQHCLFGKVIYG